MSQQQLFGRKATLLVLPPVLNEGDADAQLQTQQQALDLSDTHFAFQVEQGDTTSPNNAVIRVFNLSDSTVKRLKGEFSRVSLSAGYQDSAFGLIFLGDVKQLRIGRLSPVDTYVDLLCADGDLAYNFGLTSTTYAAGTSANEIIQKTITDMGLVAGYTPPVFTGTDPQTFARGKVSFGLCRDILTRMVKTFGATWSIQNGKVQILPLQGYLPGEAVVINAFTGMVGVPEQTGQGIKFRCLLNPKLRVGGLVQLNNKDINKLIQKNESLPIPFNQWTGIQYASKLAEEADGLYRLFVCEHSGDIRGQTWYSDCICLAVDPSAQQVVAKN